ncbi:hypothetical protein M011DRAFT_454269 [Sporormia fimetaria CBS 119925]|uniref:Uncharacterized protein n=1 Tax=Sporormia fimetaria CBS 119925 TaxID=1340428 RepID=A0A6A6UUJ3_9PLEO|nr:hypothetical protein M011DRAFT_454269 [Sporormia fimetaria CBS 119925]
MTKTFTPSCTLPSDIVRVVYNASVRSTFDILWTCLAVLALCTWSVQHLTIPPQHKPRSWRQWVRCWMRLTSRKLKWMMVTLIAAEIPFTIVLTGLISARENVKEMRLWAERDGVQWTLVHAFFANLGGFVVRIPEQLAGEMCTHGLDGSRRDEASLRSLFKLPASAESQFRVAVLYNATEGVMFGEGPWKVRTHTRALAEKAVAETDIQIAFGDFLALCQGDHWVLDSHQLALARGMEVIRLPEVRESDLEDRSKGDAFVKLLATLQILWLVLQLTMRKVRGLASSQLEVMTLAFAVCVLIIYGLVWRMPQDVHAPVVITMHTLPTPQQLVKLAAHAPDTWYSRRDIWMPNTRFHEDRSASRDWVQLAVFVAATVLASAVFGAIHLLAWNFVFPTPAEKLIWRVSSMVTIAAPLCLGGWLPFALRLDKGWGLSVTLVILVLVLVFGVYLAARLFVMVEVFRSLFFLPPGAFVSSFAEHIPHLE